METTQSNWGWFAALGVIMMIGGGMALFAPLLFSVFVEQVVGIAFVVGGLVMIVQMFATDEGWNARLIYLILGIFTLVAGALLMLNPLEGMIALTLVLITSFFVSGLMRIAVGIMARPETGSGWLIFGGVLSLVASGYLFMNYPEVSVVLLGIAAAVSLIGEGAGYIRFAYGLKNDVAMTP